jgi:SAM-dependent methyltransferase
MSRDPFADGLFPVCVATHDVGVRRLFDLATVLMLLDCRPGGRVLDLGAGSGFSSEMLARLGYDVVALDPDHGAPGTEVFQISRAADTFVTGDSPCQGGQLPSSNVTGDSPLGNMPLRAAQIFLRVAGA